MRLLPGTNDLDCTDGADLLKAIFHGKWRFLVLRELVSSPMRLSGLRRAIPDCSKKVLIDTLHGLEAAKLIARVEYPTAVKKVEYGLDSECADNVRRVILGIGSHRSSKP